MSWSMCHHYANQIPVSSFHCNCPRIGWILLYMQTNHHSSFSANLYEILSVQWRLMPWLLVLPGHQQPGYWLCWINRFLSSQIEGFGCLPHLIVEKLQKNEKIQMCFYVFQNEFGTTIVKYSDICGIPSIRQKCQEEYGHSQYYCSWSPCEASCQVDPQPWWH